jgi:hypothetical protein
MARSVPFFSPLLALSAAQAQEVVDACILRSLPVDFVLDGELSYDVFEGHVILNLWLAQPQLEREVGGVDLIYGVSAPLSYDLSGRAYEELRFELRTPIRLELNRKDARGRFELQQDFKDFALVILLVSPANRGLPECDGGVRYIVNVNAGSVPSGATSGQLPL